MENRQGRALVSSVLLVIAVIAGGCLAAVPIAAPETQAPSTTAAAAHATAPPTLDPTAAPTAVTTPVPPTATPAPPSAAPSVFDPPAAPGPFETDLYRPNAAVRQLTTEMCVGAAMQTMINLMSSGEPDRTDATQLDLFGLARELSHRSIDTLPGASPRGWAAALSAAADSDYDLLTSISMDDVLRMAARQMRLTRKPVGLTVWRGKHAWVMSGFEATADPAWTDNFDVTAVRIEDPWFGRVDSQWGAGLAPDTLVSRDDLRHDFVSWISHFALNNEARFIIVAPIS
jgi:hypothetical protein